jgi:hypothetical protein
MANVGKPEPQWNFSTDKSKFKPAFGVDGSQINPKKIRRPQNFHDSQLIDQQQLYVSRSSNVRKSQNT